MRNITVKSFWCTVFILAACQGSISSVFPLIEQPTDLVVAKDSLHRVKRGYWGESDSEEDNIYWPSKASCKVTGAAHCHFSFECCSRNCCPVWSGFLWVQKHWQCCP